MIECTDKIWQAGESQSQENAASNPYPFALPNSQAVAQVNNIIDAEWNADLALGKTVIASSTSTAANVEELDPFFVVDGKSDTYWRSGDDSNNFLLSVDLGNVYYLEKIDINWLSDSLPKTFYIFFSQSHTPPVLEDLPPMSSTSIPPFDSTQDNVPELYSIIEIGEADVVTEMTFDVSDLPSRWVHVFSDSPVDATRGFGMSDLNVNGGGSTTSKW